MSKINKIDYMVGAFLEYLSTRKIAPVLIEATDEAKIVKFSTNKGEYEVYFKYTINRKEPVKGGKTFYKWDITFTAKDLKNIEGLTREGVKVFSVNLLGNEKLTNTEIVALDLNCLEACLGDDNVNENKRLTVRRQSGSGYFYCYGTSLNDNLAIKIDSDIERYMGF